MNISFNKTKLNKLLNDISNCTKLSLCFLDKNYVVVTESNNYTPFCEEIRKNKTCYENCIISDKSHLTLVEKSEERLTYTCHSGLTETISPVHYNDTVIGFLIVGRFIDKEKNNTAKKKVKEIINKYNFDKYKMQEYYKMLPLIEQKDLDSVLSIIEICIKSMLSSGIISIDKNITAIKIENFIDEHLSEKIPLNLICKTFSLSKHALYGILKENFSKTLTEIIDIKRIKKSQELLVNSDKQITEIAEILGYYDYNYFIKKFKKRTGLTPEKYRKQLEIK